MSERKVLNKYFPVDFDPSAIPKGSSLSNLKIRVMQPFNMQCSTCGHYTVSGKKFHAKKEDSGERYLGIKIWRFFLRCGHCSAEITFKTDPEHRDYTCEHGAVRTSFGSKYKQDQVKKEEIAKFEAEGGDVLKKIESKSVDIKAELRATEELEDLLEHDLQRNKFDPAQLALQRRMDAEKWQAELDAQISEDDHQEYLEAVKLNKETQEQVNLEEELVKLTTPSQNILQNLSVKLKVRKAEVVENVEDEEEIHKKQKKTETPLIINNYGSSSEEEE